MLASSSSSQMTRSTTRNEVPTGHTAPVEVLSAPGVSAGDIRFMQGLTSAASAAVSGVAVKATEPIVVQF